MSVSLPCLSLRASLGVRVLLLLTLLPVRSLHGESTAGEAPEPVNRLPPVVRNASGDIWVGGGSSREQLVVLRWAQDLILRVEALTGITRTTHDRTLGITIGDRTPEAPASADALQAHIDGRIEQRLRISGLATLEPRVLDVALCGLLVWGYVLDHGDGLGSLTNVGAWVATDVPAAVPGWFILGVSGNLFPDGRAGSSERIWQAWRQGHLPSLATFLRNPDTSLPPDAIGATNAPSLAQDYATLVVEWLAAQAPRAHRFDRLFARLASGGALSPEWLAADMADGQGVADLEERWDRWMLTQPRRILAPGTTRAADVRRLQAELMLTRGHQGVPDEAALPLRFPISDLAAHAGARWIPNVANARILKLRTLALGRGPEFQQTVEAWCRYLEAMARGARPRRVTPLLAAAETAQAQLETALGVTAP